VAAEDKIIESLYEQFKSVTIVSIEKKNPYLLKKIVKTYEKVGLLATNNRYHQQSEVISLLDWR